MSQSRSDRWRGFAHQEMLWIVLALAWARTQTAERDDPVLVALFEEACATFPLSRDSGVKGPRDDTAV